MISYLPSLRAPLAVNLSSDSHSEPPFYDDTIIDNISLCASGLFNSNINLSFIVLNNKDIETFSYPIFESSSFNQSSVYQ